MKSVRAPIAIALLFAACGEELPPKPVPVSAAPSPAQASPFRSTAEIEAIIQAKPGEATPRPKRPTRYIITKDTLKSDLPITLRELSVILRTGQDDEHALAEVVRRGLVDAPTPEVLRDLREAGASRRLMVALENVDYVLNPVERAAYDAHAPRR